MIFITHFIKHLIGVIQRNFFNTFFHSVTIFTVKTNVFAGYDYMCTLSAI